MADAHQQGTGRRLVTKLVMPLVATGVSAAATYAAKKAPQLIEDSLMPKLREARNGAGSGVSQVPEKVKSAAGGAGDLASGLTDRVRSVAGGGKDGDDENGGGGSESRPRSASSPEDRERRQRERAERRNTRRKQSKS